MGRLVAVVLLASLLAGCAAPDRHFTPTLGMTHSEVIRWSQTSPL